MSCDRAVPGLIFPRHRTPHGLSPEPVTGVLDTQVSCHTLTPELQWTNLKVQEANTKCKYILFLWMSFLSRAV